MKVLIVGGGGAMGRWFASYFKGKGDRVFLSDVNHKRAKTAAEALQVGLLPSTAKNVRSFDLVFISVPIQETPKVIRKLGRHMARGSTLAEISSVKRGIVSALQKISRKGVKTICLHPLFGPGLSFKAKPTLAIIPVRNARREEAQAMKLFPGSTTITLGQEEHDKAIAVTIWGTYLLNLAFAKLVSQGDTSYLKKLPSPRFTVQMILSKSVLEEDPRVYADICDVNPHAQGVLRQLKKALDSIEEGFHKGGGKKIVDEIDRSIGIARTNDSYKMMYRLAGILAAGSRTS